MCVCVCMCVRRCAAVAWYVCAGSACRCSGGRRMCSVQCSVTVRGVRGVVIFTVHPDMVVCVWWVAEGTVSSR